MSARVLLPQLRSAIHGLIAEEPGESSRFLLWLLVVLFGALLLWSTLSHIDIVAVASGRLVPQTYVKIVQPADGGIVRELLVIEGQAVARGDVLIRLDPTLAAADQQSVASQLALKRLEIRRIDAQLVGRPLEGVGGDDHSLLEQVRIDGLARERSFLDQIAAEEAARTRDTAELAAARETLTKLDRTLPSYRQSASAYEKLARENLVGALDAEEKKRELLEHEQDFKAQSAHVSSLESSLRAQERKLSQIRSAYRSALLTERSQRVGEVNQLTQDLRKQGFREGLMELRAPQAGIVKDLATTTVGAVVQPGAVLLNLVPQDEPLRAEVYVRNEDVGFVRAGQHVRLKLAAYPFTKYGLLEGKVRTLAADASVLGTNAREATGTDATKESPSGFKAIIDLRTQQLEIDGKRLSIMAGMAVQAEINEGRRTVLEYLLSPLQRVADEAGGER